MTISLQLDNVTLSQRLTNVSVDVSAGNFVHLLGTNGAGKSSLLSVISGLIEPVQGKVSLR
jgi:ABC-type Mn2+/Zn2+ transport system ATPase subunit